MKQMRLAVLTVLFACAFSFNLTAADLFDLEGGAAPEGAPAEGAPADGTSPADGGASAEGVPGDTGPAAPEAQTANLAVSQAAADPKLEKEMRELSVDKKKKIKVVQKREFYKEGRAELAVGVGFIVGDWDDSMTVGAQVAYNINDLFAIQGHFFYAPINWERETRKQVNELNAEVSSSNVVMAGGLSVIFTPFYGKLSLLGNFIPKYDLNVSLGGNYYQVLLQKGSREETGHRFAVNAGFGARFFITNNFFLSLNLDWYLMGDERFKLGATTNAKSSYLKTDTLFSVNFGMFLPFAD